MSSSDMNSSAPDTTGKPPAALVALAWLWVILPFLYGLYQLVVKIPALFG
jgi:hypothetical protein